MIGFASADTIQWMGQYDRALQQAQQQHKMLLVLAVKPHCPSCNCLLSDIMNDPAAIQAIKHSCVSVIVTYNRYRNYPNELYFASRYPALFIVDPSDERFVIDPLIGVTKKDLIARLNHLLSTRREK